MNNISYESRYVAFLDLLGFKEMVAQSAGDQSILNNINRAMSYISEMQHDNYKSILSMADLGKQVTAFSDSIVISYNTSMPGGGFHVLMDLVYICNDLLGMGIPVRGGVAVGQLIHDEQKCFGPAMLIAYMLESKEAETPRILIDKDVLIYALKNPGRANTVDLEADYLKQIVKTDPEDERFFLDYLKQINEFDDPEEYNYYILKTREFIIKNLKLFENDSNIRKKYEWLEWYYNETITAVFNDPKPLLIHTHND